jgi:hypothetical protein
MAADVSLDRAIEVVGHESARGTTTKEVVAALRHLGVSCADKLRPLSRTKPVLPKCGIVVIQRPRSERHRALGHWMFWAYGEMLDPGECWPNGYEGWKITSYLEIYS